jgi:hypothetical protein
MVNVFAGRITREDRQRKVLEERHINKAISKLFHCHASHMTSETSQSRKYLDPEETERETEREKRA